jgi:hypothetical protein
MCERDRWMKVKGMRAVEAGYIREMVRDSTNFQVNN